MTCTAVLVVIALVISTTVNAESGESASDNPLNALEGKSFAGRLHGKGLRRVFSSKVVLHFKDGMFTWQNGEDFEPAPYTTEVSGNRLLFFVRAAGQADGEFADDFVEWRGYYEENQLHGVTATWARNGKGPWLYNLLLPKVVKFIFKPQATNH